MIKLTETDLIEKQKKLKEELSFLEEEYNSLLNFNPYTDEITVSTFNDWARSVSNYCPDFEFYLDTELYPNTPALTAYHNFSDLLEAYISKIGAVHKFITEELLGE